MAGGSGIPGTTQRLRPFMAFHIPRFSNKESSRQFIVRITLGKSGARFVQNGINPHLPVNPCPQSHTNKIWGGRIGRGHFIDWMIRSPGLPFDGDFGDFGDFGAAVGGGEVGFVDSEGTAVSAGPDCSVDSGSRGGGSFLSPPNCRITG